MMRKMISLGAVVDALETIDSATACRVLRAMFNVGALSADEAQLIGTDLDVDFVNGRSFTTGDYLDVA